MNVFELRGHRITAEFSALKHIKLHIRMSNVHEHPLANPHPPNPIQTHTHTTQSNEIHCSMLNKWKLLLLAGTLGLLSEKIKKRRTRRIPEKFDLMKWDPLSRGAKLNTY